MVQHILVGVVYNRNGIASWLIEAARALNSGGFRVTIVSTRSELLPPDLLPNSWIIPAVGKRSFLKKVISRIDYYLHFIGIVKFNSSFMKNAFKSLEASGFSPNLLLVAQTDFVWPAVPVKQWVVARSWPISLLGYLEKIKHLKNKSFLISLHDQLLWFSMDHKAYKTAYGVLSLTSDLTRDLQKRGYRAHTLFPCINSNHIHGAFEKKEKLRSPRLFTAALNLGDKIKNIDWMVSTLAELRRSNCSFDLTLAGSYDVNLVKQYKEWVPNVVFVGSLTRDELFQQMRDHDIFVFSSLKENFGYVLIEAMSQGMVVFTPDIYPFNEIIPVDKYRYKPMDRQDFVDKLGTVIKHRDFVNDLSKFNSQFRKKFSQEAFREQFISIITSGSTNKDISYEK